MTLYIVSIAPASAELFEAEVRRGEAESEIVERLDEHRWLVRCSENFRSLFWLHRFPVQMEMTVPDLALDTVRPFLWGGLPLERLDGTSVGIQIVSNQRLDWSFAELVDLLRADLELPEERFTTRDPQIVLSVYLHGHEQRCRVLAGVSNVQENLSSWSSGHCRIPRDPESVSRAEAKLLEAWESFGLDRDLGHAGLALDLGAAPGGWSRVLAAKGYQVDAVDPADLDPQVLALPRVTHHQETAGAFFAHDTNRYQIMVSDMKMDAEMAATLMVDSASRISPVRGRLLSTLKLGKGPTALGQAERALGRLTRAYTIIEARQLYFNRSEITVYAKPTAKRP